MLFDLDLDFDDVDLDLDFDLVVDDLQPRGQEVDLGMLEVFDLDVDCDLDLAMADLQGQEVGGQASVQERSWAWLKPLGLCARLP